MTERFEEFVSNINSAYKHIIKIKSYEMQEFGLKGANAMTLFFLGKHQRISLPDANKFCKFDIWSKKEPHSPPYTA